MKAKVIADSIHQGNRITTFQLRYPRFIHAQIMTHRVFSRSARSSRAVPVEKMIKEVRTDPVVPKFLKNKKGMQPSDSLTPWQRYLALKAWLWAAWFATFFASLMVKLKVHKQIANRLLEPFSYIDVVLTSTDWANFYGLRIDKDAQHEIQELASLMLAAHVESTPVKRQWHCPYVDSWDPLISGARCARVSFKPHDSENEDEEKDKKLADRLLKKFHMSPFEHQAEAIQKIVDKHAEQSHMQSGNFFGWSQYRKQLRSEVKKFPGFKR